MLIGIVYIPLFGQLSSQSVDDFSGMNAESTVCSHHKGFEGPTSILCRQSIFADLFRLKCLCRIALGGPVLMLEGQSMSVIRTSSSISRPSISSNPAIPKSARSSGSSSFEGRISHGSRMTALGHWGRQQLRCCQMPFLPDYIEQ
jgi:hypothetical protein